MKYLPVILCIFYSTSASAQDIATGSIIAKTFFSRSIAGNPGGEDPLRRVTIYLPHGYEETNKHYPVIYFLHGFTRTDSFYMNTFRLKELLDTAISRGIIRPVIMVLPNSYTIFQGSFYTNSPLTGNWADFIAKDVVTYVDDHFRTIRNRNSRGLCGHSMGGNGTLKIGMLYADLFGALYALSPARLDWGEGLTSPNATYKIVLAAKKKEDISNDFFAMEIADLARTYSPNLSKPPFYADLPFELRGDSLVKNEQTYKKWNDNFPINMIESHISALRSFRAIKMDWGRNDQFPFIPMACLRFSKKLEAMGIVHFAEEYIGDHRNQLGGREGRIATELLPFFNTYLLFEN